MGHQGIAVKIDAVVQGPQGQDPKPEDVYGRDTKVFAKAGLEVEDSEKWRRHFATLERRESFQGFEYATRSKEGALSHLSVSGTPVFDAAGKFAGYRGTGTDITERKHMEEILRRSQRMDAVGQLTGGVAHDFNNLLAIIIGSAELLEDGVGEDEEAKKQIEAIKTAIDRGSSLTSRLLAFARKTELSPVVVDVRVLIGSLHDPNASIWKKSSAALKEWTPWVS